MTTHDAPEVNGLSAQLGYALSVQETEEQISEVIRHPEHSAFVYMDDEKLLGFIHVFTALRIESLPFAEIGGLVVDENSRGRGIGKQLVRKAIEWSAGKNIHTLRVRCNTRRKEAHLFYTSLGFANSKDQKVFSLDIKR